MSVHVLSWVLKHSDERLGRRLTLLVLADHAGEDGSEAWPSVPTIANEARLSERQVQTCLADLVRSGAISQTGERPNGTRIYCVNMGGADSSPGGAESDEGGVKSTTSRGAKTSPEPSLLQPSTQDPSKPVADSWVEHAPPLIEHRPAYFADEKVKRRVAAAVKRYGEADVCAAVAAYAEVLASEAHFFNYRWTLGDFLTRGLDRFVPEARPLENFRTASSRNAKPQPRFAEGVDLSVYDKF